MIGRTLGHCRILERLGGSGIAVVYEAEDLKLDRMVALKFLPPELTRDGDAGGRAFNPSGGGVARGGRCIALYVE